MTEPALTPGQDAQMRLRTLILDPDESRRGELTRILSGEGLRVFSCGNIEQGRQAFDEHALVVAPLNGDSQAVVDFVHWLRTRSGRIQPYVLGVGEYHGPASEWHGFNEFVSAPLTETTAKSCLEAARRWHGWNVEINQATRPLAPPPVVRRGSESVEDIPDKPELKPEMKADSDLPEMESFDWNAAVSEESLVAKPEPELPTTPLHSLPAAVPPALTDSARVTVSEDLHLQINEASPFGLLLLDDSANLIYANPQHRAVLGVTVAEAGGLAAWLELGCAVEPQQMKATLDTWWERVWRRHLPLVLTMRSAESLLKEIEFRPSRLPDERLLVAIFDVTDARREEESMRTSEARFRNLFMQMPSMVVVVNAAGNITDVSLAFEKLVGCSRLDMRRLGLDQFFPEEDLVNMRKNAFSARQGRETPAFAVKLQPRQGPLVPLSCTISIVKNSSGAAVFTAFYFQEEVAPPVPLPVIPSPAIDAPLPGAIAARLAGVSPDLELVINEAGVISEGSIGRDFSFLGAGDAMVGKQVNEAFPVLAGNMPVDEMILDLKESLEIEVRCVVKFRPGEKADPVACEARLVHMAESAEDAKQYGLVVRKFPQEHFPEPRNSLAGGFTGTEMAIGAMHFMKQSVLVTNERGRILAMNPAAESMFGFTGEDLINLGLYRLFSPANPKEFALKISDEINRNRCWVGVTPFSRKDGTEGEAEIDLVPYDHIDGRGFIGFVREITTPQPEVKPEPQPEAKPEPKAGSMITLHRARNDLQVLSSLLSTQVADASIDDGARQALQAGKDRVSAVALVYRLLDGETGLVDFNRLVYEMGQHILRSHKVTVDRVIIDIPESPSRVPQKLAITLALIVQELLNYLLMHTFPKPSKGRIMVELRQGPEENVLSVRDNGQFQTSGMLETRSNGFGWQIVEALSQQLGGRLTVLSDLENEIALRFSGGSGS